MGTDPETQAELALRRARSRHQRFDSARLSLELSAAVIATVVGLVIMAGVYYLFIWGGFSPGTLRRRLAPAAALIVLHFLYDLWKIWRKSRVIEREGSRLADGEFQ